MAIQFNLSKVETTQFAAFPDVVKSNEFGVKVEFKFRVADNRNSIQCIGKFCYFQDAQLALLCETICTFSIFANSWQEMENADGSYTIPVGFLQHLANINTGFTRGVIFAKTEGTVLQLHVLPLLNLTEIIKDGINVKKADQEGVEE